MPLQLGEEAIVDKGRWGPATGVKGATAPRMLGVVWTGTEATALLVGTGLALLPEMRTQGGELRVLPGQLLVLALLQGPGFQEQRGLRVCLDLSGILQNVEGQGDPLLRLLPPTLISPCNR